MNIKILGKTIHTFTDWELKEIMTIIGKEEVTKRRIIERELSERKRARRQGKYVDRTLNPKVPLKKRLEDNNLV
jgi:hypothetical protein